MNTMLQLWNDDTGAVLSAEIILVSTILVIGTVSGLTTLRDSILGEMNGVASALASFDQSYSMAGTRSFSAYTANSYYVDTCQQMYQNKNEVIVQSKCTTVMNQYAYR